MIWWAPARCQGTVETQHRRNLGSRVTAWSGFLLTCAGLYRVKLLRFGSCLALQLAYPNRPLHLSGDGTSLSKQRASDGPLFVAATR